MDAIITGMVSRFERGGLSRRQLIQGLSALVAAAGGTGVGNTLVSLRQQNPPGLIDHFAISVEGFNRDAATQILKQHGLSPDNNIEFGFHVKDPDGAVVQVV